MGITYDEQGNVELAIASFTAAVHFSLKNAGGEDARVMSLANLGIALISVKQYFLAVSACHV